MSNPTLERHARLLRNGCNQAVHYAQVRVALEKMDRPLGHNDLLIVARALGLTLVTDPEPMEGDWYKLNPSKGLAIALDERRLAG